MASPKQRAGREPDAGTERTPPVMAAVADRARAAGDRLEARAASCIDPALRGVLARAGRTNRRRARRAAGWPDGVAPTHAGTAAPGGGPLVLARTDVSPDLLVLKVSRPPGFDYRAGQHVKLGLGGVSRTYSLASAPHEGHLEFFIELVPGGGLSERLRGVTPGATVELAPRAKGGLTLDPERSSHLMVATVTGVAPYISLLRDHFHGGAAGQRFIILVGASHADEHAYGEELDAMAARPGHVLSHVATVSRPDEPRNAGWQGATGRVDEHAAAAPARYGLAPDDTAVYACGNPGMVAKVERELGGRGFRVHTEPYD